MIKLSNESKKALDRFKLIVCDCAHGVRGTERCSVKFPSRKYPCGKNCKAYKKPVEKELVTYKDVLKVKPIVCIDCGDEIKMPKFKIHVGKGKWEWICNCCKSKGDK